jgi:hypothetical protein
MRNALSEAGIGRLWIAGASPKFRPTNVRMSRSLHRISIPSVVHHSVGERRAPQIGSGDSEREGLTVGRHNATTTYRNPVGLLDGKRQRMIVDFVVGPRIRIWISCDRVVFAVDLAAHSLCDGASCSSR